MAKKKLDRIQREVPTYAGPRALRDTASGRFVPSKTKPKKGRKS